MTYELEVTHEPDMTTSTSFLHLQIYVLSGESAWFQVAGKLLIVPSMIFILYVLVFVLLKVGAPRWFIVPLSTSRLYKEKETAHSNGKPHTPLIS